MSHKRLFLGNSNFDRPTQQRSYAGRRSAVSYRQPMESGEKAQRGNCTTCPRGSCWSDGGRGSRSNAWTQQTASLQARDAVQNGPWTRHRHGPQQPSWRQRKIENCTGSRSHHCRRTQEPISIQAEAIQGCNNPRDSDALSESRASSSDL